MIKPAASHRSWSAGRAAALVASTEMRTPYDAPATAMSALASNFAVMVASRDEADAGVVDRARLVDVVVAG